MDCADDIGQVGLYIQLAFKAEQDLPLGNYKQILTKLHLIDKVLISGGLDQGLEETSVVISDLEVFFKLKQENELEFLQVADFEKQELLGEKL